MKSERKFEIIFIILAFIFSWWLFSKSVSYDDANHIIYIGRNEVGDFGLHLGLIRSFSQGSNFPTESPFFPGKPLPYHYYFDLISGLLERSGVRIDLAVNFLSALSLTVLVYIVYMLSQLIFGKNKMLGIISVVLFILPSNTSFLDFLSKEKLSPEIFRDIWKIPDLITKGPFDGSLQSIYFTQSAFLNQRHLVMGLAICFAVIYLFIKKLLSDKNVDNPTLILIGVIIGLTTRVHSLVSLATIITLVVLFILFKKLRWLLPLIITFGLTTALVYKDILLSGSSFGGHNLIHLGFLSAQPFSLFNFLDYWWANFMAGLILIPLAFFVSSVKQRKIFAAFLTLFIIANLFQLSFRIEHNHSLINYFLIIADCFISYALLRIWRKGLAGKLLSLILFISLITSGFMNLMAIKNDYQYPVTDVPNDKFMAWIMKNTDKKAVFLNGQNLYDPVVLAGRRSYFGATYYLQVMGYDYDKRDRLTKEFYEANDVKEINLMREQGISYIVIPLKSVSDFPYNINKSFFQNNLKTVYQDSNLKVYRL